MRTPIRSATPRHFLITGDIEHTAGTRESAIHAAMMLEGGVATMLGLFCEINAGVLATTYGTLAVHELTAINSEHPGL